MTLPASLFTNFQTFFETSNLEPLELALNAIYKDDFKQFKIDFYETLIRDEDQFKQVLELLHALNIPFDGWGQFLMTSFTVHGLLSALSKSESKELRIQVHQLLDLINKKERNHKLYLAFKFFIAGLFTLIITAILLNLIDPLLFSFQNLMKQLNYLYYFLVEKENILPAVGVVTATSVLGICIYFLNNDDRKSPEQIKSDRLFILFSSSFNIVGKILLVIAHTSLMMTLAQSFFIAAELVNLLKHGLHYIDLRSQANSRPQFSKTDALILFQQSIRFNCDLKKERNDLIISSIAAVCILGLAVSCLFIAPSLVFAITAVSCGVYALEQLSLYLNQKLMAKDLDKKLRVVRIGAEAKKAAEEAAKLKLKEEKESTPVPNLEQDHVNTEEEVRALQMQAWLSYAGRSNNTNDQNHNPQQLKPLFKEMTEHRLFQPAKSERNGLTTCPAPSG